MNERERERVLKVTAKVIRVIHQGYHMSEYHVSNIHKLSRVCFVYQGWVRVGFQSHLKLLYRHGLRRSLAFTTLHSLLARDGT